MLKSTLDDSWPDLAEERTAKVVKVILKACVLYMLLWSDLLLFLSFSKTAF